jgi:phage terminase large subunit
MAQNVSFPKKLDFLFQPARYKICHGGRGSGKSWGFARALLVQGAARPLRVLCARESQRSIADSVHKLLRDQIDLLGLGGFYTVQESTIFGQNGTEFVFAGIRQQGIQNIKSFEGVDVAWIEEAQVVTKRSWDVLLPTIRKEGSEIWITMNPDLESDETYVRFIAKPPPGAIVVQLNWSDNPWFTKALDAERRETKARSPEDYANIWEGKPKRVVDGAIYRSEIDRIYDEKRLRDVPYDPLLKVHTVWDLGWNDAMTVIFAQRSASEIRVIDYIEDSHKRLDEYVGMIESRRYRYGSHWLPHDGRARNIQTGLSPQEMLKKLTGHSVKIVPEVSVESGIKAARVIFGRCYFDAVKAGDLVDRLKRYRRAIPVNTGEPAAPLHDENSHGADAFRYLALVADKMHNSEQREQKIKYPEMGIV